MSHMNASHNKRESAQARPEQARANASLWSATFRTELIKPPATAELQRNGLPSSHSPGWSQSQFRFVWDYFAKGCDFCWLSRVWHMEIIKSAAKHQAQSSKKPRLRQNSSNPPSTTLLGRERGLWGTLRHIVTLLWHFVLLPLKNHTQT